MSAPAFGRLGVERVVAAAWGFLFTAILGALIVLGSRRLAHFDAALVGYTFATLFATFGITYRYAMWLQRPPTRMYWRRGWQAFFRPGVPSAQPASAGSRASPESSPRTASSSAAAGCAGSRTG